MRLKLIKLMPLLAVAAFAAGCSTGQRAGDVTGWPAHASAAPPAMTLVMPGAELASRPRDDAAIDASRMPPWEYARNDQRMGSDPVLARQRFVEVRHIEHLRTINGRPCEFSTTRTRVIERTILP